MQLATALSDAFSRGFGGGTLAHRSLADAIEHWRGTQAPDERTAVPDGIGATPLQDRVRASMRAVEPAHARVVGRCLGVDGRAVPPALAAAQEGLPEREVAAMLDAAMKAVESTDGWPGELRDMLLAEPRESLDDLCEEPWARTMPETSVVALVTAVSRLTGTPLRAMLPRP